MDLDEGSSICESPAIANAPRRSEAFDAADEQEFLHNSNVLQMQVEHQACQFASLDQQLHESSRTIEFLQYIALTWIRQMFQL